MISTQIHFAGGDGYPSAGTYPGTMTKNRTINVVGDPKKAKNGYYLIRDVKAVKKSEGYDDMNLTHWSKVDVASKPDHFCSTVLADIQEEKQIESFKKNFRI